jgi:hypothetical protein
MSKIALASNVSGTGTLTIASPNTDSDRVLTLPDTTAPILAGSGITLSASAPADTLITTDAGRVGFGIAAPAAVVDALQEMRVSFASGNQYRMRLTDTDGNGRVFVDGDTSALIFGTSGAGFGATAAERMRITSGGNVLIGRTTTVVDNLHVGLNGLFAPAGGIDPGGNIGGTICFGGQYGSPVAGRIFFGDGTGWRMEMGPRGINGFVSRFQFTDAGQAFNTTGTWGSISDARLKENVTDATPKLNDLLNLRVRNFNFITEPGKKQIGFVAQELEQVFPGLVDNTKPDENGDSTKSVKTTVLIPMLVKAIQELNAKVDAQAAEIAALKGQS